MSKGNDLGVLLEYSNLMVESRRRDNHNKPSTNECNDEEIFACGLRMKAKKEIKEFSFLIALTKRELKKYSATI